MFRIILIVLSFMVLMTASFGVMVRPALALSCARIESYQVTNSAIIYRINGYVREDRALKKQIELVGVDRGSFKTHPGKILRWQACVNPYASDKKHAFYRGKVIEGVAGATFRRKQGPWFTDGHVLLLKGKIIGKAGQEKRDLGGGYYALGGKTFFQEIEVRDQLVKIPGQGYAISKTMVYFRGKPSQYQYDPKTFQVINWGYLRDKNGIYCQRTGKLAGADPATFTVQTKKADLAADKNHFYYECRLVESGEGRYMDVFDHGFLRDSEHVYFMGKRVAGLDAASFVLHFQGGKYIQDKNGAYYIQRKNFRDGSIVYKKIAGADLATFQATARNKAEDLYNLYQKDKRTGENWDGLKKNPNSFFRVPRKRLYRLSIPVPFAQNF